MTHLIVLVGQTAVGKTALSLRLAKTFHGEILSIDSRLFYRGLDIGTAKPSHQEMAEVVHHFIDICEPSETLTLAEFQEMAYAKITDCHQRGVLPIMVGGTGQYVKAVVEGWGIPRVPPHPDLRASLELLGWEECARWLQALDPIAAERLDPRNMRRVIRALEVTLVSGIPISILQKKNPPPYQIKMIGLFRDRQLLYDRIDQRVDAMLANGLLTEVQGLIDRGVSWDQPAMSGLGYRQLKPYFDGEQSLDEAVDRIKYETHRFSRQQNTWFRRDDSNISWFDASDDDLGDLVIDSIHSWLLGKNG